MFFSPVLRASFLATAMIAAATAASAAGPLKLEVHYADAKSM